MVEQSPKKNRDHKNLSKMKNAEIALVDTAILVSVKIFISSWLVHV